MARSMKQKTTPNDRKKLTINLFGQGMTILHKVGLAGLWMTLKAIEDENGGQAGFLGIDGSWERTDTSVTFQWNDDPVRFFKTLVEKSFRIDKNGLIWLTALGRPMNNPGQAKVLQESLLGTLLQHGKTRKADPSQKPGGSLSVDIDGSVVPMKFRLVTDYAHQHPDFRHDGINIVAGWQFPGGVVRHTGLGQTALEEPPERALSLLFIPAGTIFFEIRSLGGGVRPRYSLVFPEINSLTKYYQARRVFLTYGVRQLQAGGTTEAGFRVLAELSASGILGDVRSARCSVVSFGIVPWSQQQKTRVGLMTVQARSDKDLRIFNLCRQVLIPQLVRPEKEDPFWAPAQSPDLVARNLAEGKPWWQGFANFVADGDRRNHIFKYEKGGLSKMVENREAFPEGAERAFVEACHEAWRRRMGQIGEKAKRERSSFRDQVNREFVRTRVAFSRCKNCAALRQAVTDFWARAGGSIKPLQEGWRDVIILLDEENWQKARDLALLALVSYRPATPQEAEALENLETTNEGGDQQ